MEIAAERLGPHTETERNEQHERLRRAVTSMPERDHAILLLRYYMRASWHEIAHEIDAPTADAARKEHHRMVVRLAERFAE